MVDITEILVHWCTGTRAAVSKATIHQRLRDEHGVSASAERVCGPLVHRSMARGRARDRLRIRSPCG